MSAELDTVNHVTLGLGVNVNQTTAEFPPELRGLATSVRIAVGQPLDRAELAAAILRELDHAYERVRSGQFESMADEWEACCSTLGQSVVVRIGERRVRGRAEALDPDGALLLRTEHGHLERITGGDVTVEK
jgi:BirA family biotin operon repressor/biotin-[acetyl-CoA-carboxylase] ligase